MDSAFVVLGLLAGVLVGMTGVGAGSLVTPALALSGVPAAVAVGTDLACAAVSKSFGAAVHRLQRTLDLRIAALLAASSVPAAVLTVGALALTGAQGNSALITGTLALAMILTALALLVGRVRVAAFAARYEAAVAPWRVRLTIAAGALIGVLVTLSSVGAGALGAVMLVALYPSMSAAHVAGVDIAHAVPLTLTAGLGHLWLGNVDLVLAGALLAGAVPGIVAGSLLAGRLPESLVRRLLALVLLYAGARLAAASV